MSGDWIFSATGSDFAREADGLGRVMGKLLAGDRQAGSGQDFLALRLGEHAALRQRRNSTRIDGFQCIGLAVGAPAERCVIDQVADRLETALQVFDQRQPVRAHSRASDA